MDNYDEESVLSATEKRLQKGITTFLVGVQTKKKSSKIPIKRRTVFFKQIDKASEENDTPFKPGLIIENEDFVGINEHILAAKDFKSDLPDSIISGLDGSQVLALGRLEEDENILRAVAGAAILDSDNESYGEAVRQSEQSSEGFSSESSAQRGAVSHDEVYVRVQVDYRTGHILLSVSRLRPDTYLGRQQGAHITAYAVYVTSILESIDEQTIHEIPGLLGAIAKKFIPEERWTSLDEKIQIMLREIPEHFINKNRKKITRDLRGKHVEEGNVKIIKTALKVQQATFLAQLIGIISQEVLEGINQNSLRLYQRPKKKTKQDLGREGARIRQSLQSLCAIKHLIKWKHSDKVVTTIPEALKKGSLRQGIKIFLGAGKHDSEEINAFIQSFKANSISQEKFESISKVLGRLLFDLFDFDYYEYKAALIVKAIANKDKRSNFEQLVYTIGAERAIGVWCEQEKITVSERVDLRKINNEILENAIEIVSQHFDIVMHHAFSSFKRLPLEAKHIIYIEFLGFMQKNMNWPEQIMKEISPLIIDRILGDEELTMKNLSETFLY